MAPCHIVWINNATVLIVIENETYSHDDEPYATEKLKANKQLLGVPDIVDDMPEEHKGKAARPNIS